MGHLLRLLHSKVREAAKRGSTLALVISGELKRSPHWSTVEKAWLAKHPRCAACGGSRHVQVHHIRPFHEAPELELADGTGRFCRLEVRPGVFACNLISLCMGPHEDHLRIGHGGHFHRDNPNVVEDARQLLLAPSKRQAIEIRAQVASVAQG